MQPKTTTNYDLLGRPTSIVQTDGTTQSIAYANELVTGVVLSRTTATDAENHAIIQYKDALGQLVKSQPAAGPSVTYQYDSEGQLTTANYGPATTTLTYDLAGRKRTMTDADMGYWKYTYDVLGNLYTQTDARGCVTTLVYDTLNRLTGKTYASCPATVAPVYSYTSTAHSDTFPGTTLPTGWSKAGNAVVANGYLTLTGNNTWANSASRTVTMPSNTIARVKFKARNSGAPWGKIFIDAGTPYNADYRRWGIMYDNTSIYQHEMVSGTTNQTYIAPLVKDVWYQLTLEVEGNNLRILLVRLDTGATAWEKIENRTWGPRSWRFMSSLCTGITDIDTYEEIVPGGNVGQRTRVTDGSGRTDWTYDARGRVTSESKTISGVPFTTGYTYNSANLPVTMTYPGMETVTFGYITNMLSLDTVSGTDGYVTNMNYDPAGRLKTLAMGNGVTVNRAYYAWDQQGGRLQSVQAGAVQNLSYTYDNVGNITGIVDAVANNATLSFAYDELNRLVTSTYSTGYFDQPSNDTPEYDSTTGNLKTANGNSLFYTDNAHKHAATSSSDGRTYAYDANGNMTTRVIGGVTYTLTYDAENRLVSYVGGIITANFLYDADGNRVQGTVNGVTIKYVGAHYEVEGSTIRKYYYAGGTRVAMRTGTATPNYFLTDHLGSTAVTLDASGARVAELRYSAWGKNRYTFGTTPTTYNYTGQRNDGYIKF